jgi:hypothetical protein
METLLIAVTIVSLGVALTMSRVAWRASQDQKRLAAARVAALAAAAEVPAETADAAAASHREALPQAPVSPWRNPVSVAPDPGLSTFASETTRPAVTTPAIAAASPAAGSVSVPSSFLGAETPVPESNLHQRWLAAAAAVLAVVLGGFVYLRVSGTDSQPVAAQLQAASSPLELLSLRHERQGVNLAVAGLVRNPVSGPIVERVTAVVFLFDQQGTFVTSAKAPIDFLKLTAGDESPFVVKVAAPQSVARYRVSFRTDDGTLPHVDRRGEPPVSAPVALTRQ